MSLTCAVPKGRPMDDLMPYFQKLGGGKIPWSEVSRKLTVVDPDLGLTFFLSKAMDVPTFVEYGAADLGISGKDVLMEHDRHVVELLDLGISRCELIVAVEKTSGITRVGDLGFNSRVATKYPRVAEKYFNRLGLQVEIVPLSGSIELAPLVGLADAIVDITETGTTLRENGLEIIGRVAQSSMRLIANPVSYKVHYDEIRSLTHQLRSLLRTGVSAG